MHQNHWFSKNSLKWIICFLTAMVTNVVHAQNLVPDPSFENVFRLPTKKENSLTCTKNWMSPTNGVSDYYHQNGKRHAGVPRNIFGKQKPHSGIAYAGICVRTHFIEYVQTKLVDTLKKDQDYLVEFYVSRAERSIGKVREFGVLFTQKMTWGLTDLGIPVVPPIEFLKPSGYKNKKKWMKLSAVYHATGNELVIIIGPFKNEHSKRFRGFAHYYIDDVSITPIISKKDSVHSSKVSEAIPEFFSPKIGEIVTLNNVFFATNQSEFLPQSFSELDRLVSFLKENINTRILISGHTDNTGNEEQNKLLSMARAKAVANYLLQNGVSELQIEYMGYGSSKPIKSNETEEGKQANRRVEFVVKN